MKQLTAYTISWFGAATTLGLVIFLPLFFDLDRFSTADEKRWQANVAGFTEKLAHGKLGQLLQQPHPGITTQWLGALTIHSDSWTVRKLPLILGHILLILMIGYFAARLWGKSTGILSILILASNPFLVAHIRVYAMDSLLALFCLLALMSFFLWESTSEKRYLIFSALSAAAAFLSKLPGIIVFPFILSNILMSRVSSPRGISRHTTMILWIFAFIVSSAVILPQIAIDPSEVLGDFREFFTSDDYRELHVESQFYYFTRTLPFFSTPVQIIGLLLMPLAWKHITSAKRRQLAILLVFVMLFTIMMSSGSKMGDRYLLPVFVCLDIIAAMTLMRGFRNGAHVANTSRIGISGLTCTRLAVGLLIGSMAISSILLHPYYLAYVNPLTKPFFDSRRLGWGEGLDIAAHYLNKKSDARNLKVASYYPVEFSTNFVGETVPLHQWDHKTIDYVVLYRAQFERGPNAWETDVLNHFARPTPEHTILLNNLPYAWIYKKIRSIE